MAILEFLFNDFWHWLGGLIYIGAIFSGPWIFIDRSRNYKSKEDKDD
jgi:hypothetical protein